MAGRQQDAGDVETAEVETEAPPAEESPETGPAEAAEDVKGVAPEQIMPDADPEALRAEIRRARDDAARYRRQLRENPEPKPEADALTRIAALEQQLTEERRSRALAEVSAEFRLSPAQAKHLSGNDPESLRASAEALITAFGVQASTMPAAPGARPNLTGGTEPAAPVGQTPEEIVNAVLSRRRI